MAPEDREEVLVLTGVLHNELTRGYEGFEDEVVYAIDGAPVRSLEHLSNLLDEAGATREHRPRACGVLTIPRDVAIARRDEILARYGVGSDRSPDLSLPADLPD